MITNQQDLPIPALTDPVCGAQISIASPHSCVRAGAMFSFCSAECRIRFLANPLKYVIISLPAHRSPESLAVPIKAKTKQEKPPHPEGIGRIADSDSNPGLFRAPVAANKDNGREALPSGVPSAEPANANLERWLGGGGLREWIASRINSWLERRHAARASQEILAIYRAVVAEQPRLGDREHYKLVIMSRKGCDSQSADLILESAAESFAEWPVRRNVTLCDVVHYLSISEFLSSHRGEHWMHSDINHVVASCIPADFCVESRVKAAEGWRREPEDVDFL